MRTKDIIDTMEAMAAVIRELHSSRNQAALDLCRRSMAITEALRREAGISADAPLRSGDCDLCGEWSDGLVQGACPSCSERHRPTMALMLAVDPVEAARRAGGL